jgi:hypothetical protein
MNVDRGLAMVDQKKKKPGENTVLTEQRVLTFVVIQRSSVLNEIKKQRILIYKESELDS